MKKQRALIKPLKTIRYIRLALNKSSPLFPQLYPMECRPICRFLLLLLLLLLLLRILIKEVGVEIKFSCLNISACILGGAMKFSIQVLQQYISLPKNPRSSSLLLKPAIRRFFYVQFIRSLVSRDNLHCI